MKSFWFVVWEYMKFGNLNEFSGNWDWMQLNLLLICGDSLSQNIFSLIFFAGFPANIVLWGMTFPVRIEYPPKILPDDIKEFLKRLLTSWEDILWAFLTPEDRYSLAYD